MEKIKLILWEILFLLITTILGSGLALFQTIAKVYAGEYSSFIFGGSIYRYNFFFYILGFLLYIGIAFVIYRKWFNRYFLDIARSDILTIIIASIILVVFGFIMFAGELFALFMTVLGLSNDLRPEALVWITIVGWPVITVAFVIIQLIRNRKAL